jgi:hypothetical protein
MLTYLRYALATFCFAASVGCLALWWRSNTFLDRLEGTDPFGTASIHFSSQKGSFCYAVIDNPNLRGMDEWSYFSREVEKHGQFVLSARPKGFSRFTSDTSVEVFFPLWYPALIFALAGVGVLRLGRRFTLRSAIIATTVVAGLLGMAVGL